MTTQQLRQTLHQREKATERLIGEARGVASELTKARTEAEALTTNIEAAEEAIAVLGSFADERQAELRLRIETLVTYGLRTIFDDDLSFHVSTATKGKLTTMDFTVRSTVDGQVVETDVMDARGGGVAAVAGFLLRLIILLLRDDARPILFLDESFAQLSAEYEPRLAEFVRELVDRSKVQILLVTHSDAYSDAADRVYRFKLEDGRTTITEG